MGERVRVRGRSGERASMRNSRSAAPACSRASFHQARVRLRGRSGERTSMRSGRSAVPTSSAAAFYQPEVRAIARTGERASMGNDRSAAPSSPHTSSSDHHTPSSRKAGSPLPPRQSTSVADTTLHHCAAGFGTRLHRPGEDCLRNRSGPPHALGRAAGICLPVGRALLPVLCVFDGQECPSYR